MSAGGAQGRARILCIRLSSLGDVVHSLNALSLLRRERPGAFIAWAVEERFAGLLRDHPQIDELMALPRGAWGRMLRNPLRWPALLAERRAVAARVRSMAFDVSLDFQSSFKSIFLVRAARARLRVGFGGKVNREFNRLAQNRLVEAAAGIHRVERALALLAPLGIEGGWADAEFPPTSGAAPAVDRALEGLAGGGPLVVVHPGTSAFAAFKRWPPERYAAVADRLAAERGADIVLSSGPADRELAEDVAGRMARPVALTPPGTGLPELVELLRRTDLFIGSDTGPMHIASALKAPAVALFGPKDPEQTGPYCSRSLAVVGDAPCRPCTRRRCDDVICMTSITVEQVAAAAEAVLDGGGSCRCEERAAMSGN